MPETLPGDVHDPASGEVIPSSWGDAVNAYAADQDSGPGARVYDASSQSITADTWTTVECDSELHDTEDLHDNAVNNSRLTVPAGKGGVYLLAFHRHFVSDGTKQHRFRLNGSATFNLVSNTAVDDSMTTILALSGGDYVEVQVYSGVSDSGTISSVRFAMHRIGPSS